MSFLMNKHNNTCSGNSRLFVLISQPFNIAVLSIFLAGFPTRLKSQLHSQLYSQLLTIDHAVGLKGQGVSLWSHAK